MSAGEAAAVERGMLVKPTRVFRTRTDTAGGPANCRPGYATGRLKFMPTLRR